MAKTCHCGCGSKLGLNDRSISKKAVTVADEVEFLERYALPMQKASTSSSDRLEAFIEDGRLLSALLTGIVHRERDAREVDRRHLADWHGRAKRIINQTKVTMYKMSREPASPSRLRGQHR